MSKEAAPNALPPLGAEGRSPEEGTGQNLGLTPRRIVGRSKQPRAALGGPMWLHGPVESDWFWVSGPASATALQLGSSSSSLFPGFILHLPSLHPGGWRNSFGVVSMGTSQGMTPRCGHQHGQLPGRLALPLPKSSLAHCHCHHYPHQPDKSKQEAPGQK